MAQQKSFILYGNCQPEAMTTVLAADPLVASYYEPAYYRSYVHPTEGEPSFEERRTRKCALLWEQHDPQPFPQRALLPRECVTVTFPSVDLALLWPFNCINPFNASEGPDLPFGRFAYGDRVIVNAIERGMSADDVLEYYSNSWEDYQVDLGRLLRLEEARVRARDRHCDVTIGEFVLQNFRKKRLFWTVNHPTSAMLCELIERLLYASGRAEPALLDADIEGTLAKNFRPAGPLGVVSVPIHPRVAEYLELEWYDPNERYAAWDGKVYSYTEYFETMIHEAFGVRGARTAAPTPAP